MAAGFAPEKTQRASAAGRARADWGLSRPWQVAKLRAYHYTAQTRPEKKHMSRFGLDLINGAVRNNVDAGVLEPVLAKIKIIQARLCPRATCLFISWCRLIIGTRSLYEGSDLYVMCWRQGAPSPTPFCRNGFL